MSTKIRLLVVTLFSIVLLSGCVTDYLEIKTGRYDGMFTVIYGSEMQTGPVTLELNNGRFSCSRNPNRIPAGGSGTYTFNNETITFIDENVWTADFDWGLILNRSYNYTFDGEKLTLSASKNDAGYYKYDLKKIK